MKVRILLFARLRELAGWDSLEMDLPERATLGDVWRRLQGEVPGLAAFTRPPLMARNQEYAVAETSLKEKDEIAFLPPVSGG